MVRTFVIGAAEDFSLMADMIAVCKAEVVGCGGYEVVERMRGPRGECAGAKATRLDFAIDLLAVSYSARKLAVVNRTRGIIILAFV